MKLPYKPISMLLAVTSMLVLWPLLFAELAGIAYYQSLPICAAAGFFITPPKASTPQSAAGLWATQAALLLTGIILL